MTVAEAVRRVPGFSRMEGALRGAVASADDLPIARYEDRTAEGIAAELPPLSQRDLRMVEVYERRHEDRATITDRIRRLSGAEPWPGYDDERVEEIRRVLTSAPPTLADRVRAYERRHKQRAGVIERAEARH